MQKQGHGIDHPRLRRSSDSATPKKRKKRHTVPLLEKLQGMPPKDKTEGLGRRRFTNPFKRQTTVFSNLISLLSMKGPTSLLSAYRYYIESSFANPHHFTTYTRMNGKLRGHIRIENKGGQSVMSPHYEILSIEDDELVKCALENDSIYLIEGKKIYSIDRAGTDRAVRKENIPFVSGLSRMVIPLEDGSGLIDITGEDLSFGLFSRLSKTLRIAKDFSNLVSMKMASEIDALTGLLNRRAFDHALEHYYDIYSKLGKNTSLLMIDIDHFKEINDTHGHQNGDRVLSTCALAAMSCFRESDLPRSRRDEMVTRVEGEEFPELLPETDTANAIDEMVTRFGGEEFAVLLPETDTASAINAAERFRQEIKSIVTHGTDGEKITVTVSVGVASFEDAERKLIADASVKGIVVYPKKQMGEMILQVQKLADDALYHAKESGRNQVATASDERGQVVYVSY